MAITPVSAYEELIGEIGAAPAEAGDTDTDIFASNGAQVTERRISIPSSSKALQANIISLFHDNPESGHFGILNTAELVSRGFYWPRLEQSVRAYITGCQLCRCIKAPRHVRHGTTLAIPSSERP